MKSSLFVSLFLVSTLLAQSPPDNPNEVITTVECENGSVGDLAIADFFTGLTATATFVKVSDCASKVAAPALKPGACVVRPRTGAPNSATTTPAVATPSPTTPLISFLDAGPVLLVKGPGREVRLNRSVNGPATSYGFQEGRTISGGVLPQPDLATAGRISVSAEGGRDIGAFQVEFDYEPMRVTSPSLTAPLSAATTTAPTLEWTGGAGVRTPVEVRASASSTDGRQGVDVICRLEDARAGSFTIPAEVWSQVPASIRSAGIATFSLLHAAPLATLPAGGLDLGLRVTVLQVASANTRLTP